MPLYQRLKDLREDNDLTLKEVADVINTSYQYYQKYEKGIRDLPLERAIKLAKFYKVSIDYIAGLTNDKRGIGYTGKSGSHNISNVTINGSGNVIKNK